MMSVCSAAPCCSSFPHITYAGSRMLYRLRKLSEYRCFIDERKGFYAQDGNCVQYMSFKTKAAKFIHSPVVETPDLSSFQDPSVLPPYPNSFDDIARGFLNENIDEHEKWSCLANEINISCPLADNLKYVEDSDMPRSYVLSRELEGEYLYGINHGRTSLESLASQNINLSTVTNSGVDEVAKLPVLDQNLDGPSNLASKESSYLMENVGSFFSGIEESVDELLNRAAKGVTETYDSVVSSLISSIDKSKGQASNQVTGFSIKLEENISKGGALVIDFLRWIISGVEDGISNGVTFVVYNYASAKTFLPPDIRNALSMFEDDASQSLSPISANVRKVFETIEELERNLGLNPNDPLVPFLLLVGTTTILGISYWVLTYDGYSLSPEITSELLKNDKNVLLVDVRPEAIRERDGIPDLRREARSKYASINLIEIDNSTRKLLKGGIEVDNTLIAVVIRNLKNRKKGMKIVVLDSDTGRSKAIARSLKNLGVKESYLVEGGFQAWTRKGLRIKVPRPETTLTILNEEVEAILEDVKPSPAQFIGYGLGALVVIYALLEWEKTLQIIGIVGLGQTLYRRVASYKDSEDLKRDVRLLLAPVTLGANTISWVSGKLEPKMIGLPTSPLSTAVQDRVLQAAAKHESQPAENSEEIQGQASESSTQVDDKLDLSEA